MNNLLTCMTDLIAQLEAQLAGYQRQNAEQNIQIASLIRDLKDAETDRDYLYQSRKEHKKTIRELNAEICELHSDIDTMLDRDSHSHASLTNVLWETIQSQEKNGNRISFVYKQLTINGRFRDSPFGSPEDWRLCLMITTSKPQMKSALSKYNVILDDITGLLKAVEQIHAAAIAVDRYVGDYFPELVDSVLDECFKQDNSETYMNVVTRKFIKRTHQTEKKFYWSKDNGIAIPHDSNWNVGDVLKMFLYHRSL